MYINKKVILIKKLLSNSPVLLGLILWVIKIATVIMLIKMTAY